MSPSPHSVSPLHLPVEPATFTLASTFDTSRQDFISRLSDAVGIEAWRIPIVIASAVGIYVLFLLLVRLFGVRILSSFSSFDAIVIIMFGAVAGRVIIGHPPTLAAGAIGLTTLMAMEALFGAAQDLRGARRTLSAPPVVIFAHGASLPEAMRREHISTANLNAAIRSAGFTHTKDVQCVIREPTGALSVLRAGQPIAPELLDGVEGAELLLTGESEPGLSHDTNKK